MLEVYHTQNDINCMSVLLALGQYINIVIYCQIYLLNIHIDMSYLNIDVSFQPIVNCVSISECISCTCAVPVSRWGGSLFKL